VKSGVQHRFSPKFPGFFLMVATWVNYFMQPASQMTWVFAVPVTGETDADLPLHESTTVTAARGLPDQYPAGCTLAGGKQVVGKSRAAVRLAKKRETSPNILIYGLFALGGIPGNYVFYS
jgi:hypothetical protein